MKRLLPHPLSIIQLSVMALIFYMPCSGMVIWPPASDVTDEDILITRDVRMPRGTTTITATNADPFQLTVSLSKDSDLKGNECGDAILDLVTQMGEGGPSSITFDVTAFDLGFIGQSKKAAFIIQREGGADVEFIINNGHKVIFENKD